jgi:hypothetical protein
MNTITAGDKGDSSSAKQDQQRHRLETKIAFIESQIDSLPGFLPDSYQYLMQQLDQNQHQLLKILLQDEFNAIDCIESSTSEY